MSLAVSLYPAELHAETSNQGEETAIEASGFDENAHGEVIQTGLCGPNAYDAEYKLYEDGTLYIYGNRREIVECEIKNFSNLYIEDGVTKIGNGAIFSDCLNLENVTIANSVKSIGSQAFSRCNNLKEIEIPYGVEYIGNMAFYECENLATVNIADTITEIDFYAFGYCKNLKNVKLSNNISKLGGYLFFDCTSLENVELPPGIKIIESFMFCGCENLKNINLPNNVSEISQGAFEGCMKLTNISIPKTVEKILTNAFRGCITLTISCESGSYAHQYARENDIPVDIIHTHKYESTITKKPTCTEAGFRTYTCSCGDEYTEEISATGHEPIIDPAIAPTATETGKTEGSHCVICGKVLKAQEIIPATGKPEEPDIEVKNIFNGCKGSPLKLSVLYKENDNFTFECKDNCKIEIIFTGYSSIQSIGLSSNLKNYELTFNTSGEHILSVYKNGKLMENEKIIVAENHSWDSGKIAENQTCVKNGKKTYTCSNCRHTYTKAIPATGHKPSKWKISKKATIFKSGKEITTCTICSKILNQRTIKKLKSSVKLSKNKLTLKKGKTYKLKIKKQTKGDKISSWTSSKKKNVTVNKKTGKIKALKKGKAKITLKMKSGCKASCTVTVK